MKNVRINKYHKTASERKMRSDAYKSEHPESLEISSKEFRQNMGHYLDAINDGKSIIIKTRSRGRFRILPVKDDEDSLSAKEAFRDAFRELKAYLKGETDMLTEEEFWNEIKVQRR